MKNSLVKLFSISLGIGVVVVVFALTGKAQAATYTVNTNTADGTCDSTCTIVEAFAAANDGGDVADTITLAAGTWNAGSTQLTIAAGEPLIVQGATTDETLYTITSSFNPGGGPTGVIEAAAGTTSGGLSLANFTISTSASPWAAVIVNGAYNGNISINNIVTTGSGLPGQGIWIGGFATEGYSMTSNVSITNSTLAVNSGSGPSNGVFVGLPGGQSPTTAAVVTGTLTITGNTMDIEGTSGGNGVGGGVVLGSVGVTGAVDVSNNTVNIAGTDAVSLGVIAFDFYDLSGAVFGSTVDINSNTITSSVPFAGGIYSGTPSTGVMTIDGNTISGELDDTGNLLAGVGAFDFRCMSGGTNCVGLAEAVITDNTVTLNSSTAINTSPLVLAMADTSTISGNTVALSDGSTGVFPGSMAMAAASGSASLTTSIHDNSVSGFGNAGILVLGMADSQTVTANVYNNAVFHGTGADVMGIGVAAMSMGGPSPLNVSIVTAVYNNTIADVTDGTDADATGALVFMLDDTDTGTDHLDAYVFNNIITANSNGIYAIGMGGGEDLTVTSDNNFVYANTVDGGTNFTGATAGGDDNEIDDPELADIAGGDLSLDPTSPAMDTGVASFSTALINGGTTSTPSTDILATARPQRTVDDVGAYEHVNLPPAPSVGSNQTFAPNTTTLTPTCTANDPEGDSVTYEWGQTDGGKVSFSSTTVANPTITPVQFTGAYDFTCGVTDEFDDSGAASVILSSTDLVTRLSGANRYETGNAISQNSFADGSVATLVIASGEQFPDALTAGPLAALVGGPVLLTTKSSVPSSVLTEIERVWDGNAGAGVDIYVVGGTAVIDNAVITQLEAISGSPVVQRIAGANRLETSTLVAQEMDTIRGTDPTAVVVVYGYHFADASAMASPATNPRVNSRFMPILLTQTASLSSTVTDYLSSVNATVANVHIGGGTAVVSADVATALATYGTVTRHSGANRYATAQQIATDFYSADINNVALATGLYFPDVLTGGPMAGAMNMPVLYTNDSTFPTPTSDYIDTNSTWLFNGFVLGGPAVVPDSIITTLEGLL